MSIARLESNTIPSVFIRRDDKLVMTREAILVHHDLVSALTLVNNEDWKNIAKIPKERKRWDMGLYRLGESGKIEVGGYSQSFDFPKINELPIFREITMKTLSLQYPHEKFIEVSEEVVLEWFSERRPLFMR